MKKLQKLDEFKKFAILKREYGLKVKIYANNLTIKDDRNKMELNLIVVIEEKLILKYMLSLF